MHLSAYFSSAIAAVADTDIAALTDVFAVIQNSHFLFQTNRYLHWAAYLSGSALRAKLNAADLRVVTNPYLRPVGSALLPGSNPNWADYRNDPLQLTGLEEVGMLVTDTAVAHNSYGLIATDPNPTVTPAPAGKVYTLRGTSTTTATASAWTQVSVTWQDTLPGGQFICVGFHAQSTNLIAARLIFPNQAERPGVIGLNALTNQDMFRGAKGPQGILGRFASTFIPIPEVLANAGDASFEFYLDIMRA